MYFLIQVKQTMWLLKCKMFCPHATPQSQIPVCTSAVGAPHSGMLRTPELVKEMQEGRCSEEEAEKAGALRRLDTIAVVHSNEK